MKCVCGHEGEVRNLFNPSDKDFIKSNLIAKYDVPGNRFLTTEVEETVYICPKCGTLKINLGWRGYMEGVSE